MPNEFNYNNLKIYIQENTTYSEQHALEGTIFFFLVWLGFQFLVLVIRFTIYGIKLWKEKNNRKVVVSSGVSNQALENTSIPLLTEEIFKSKKNNCNDNLRIMFLILSWLIWGLFAFIPAILSGFHVMSFGLAAFLTFLVYIKPFYNTLSFFEEKNLIARTSFLEGIKKKWQIFSDRRKFFTSQIIFMIFMTLFLPLLTYDSCLISNVEIGTQIFGYKYTSWLTRYLNLDDFCTSGICHVYTTLPEDSATSVFVNLHSSPNIDDITIYYDKVGNSPLQFSASTMKIVPDFETRGARNIYSGLLKNLSPSTSYNITINYNLVNQSSYIYQTFPDESDTNQNFNLIVGGDVGSTSNAQQLASIAKEQNPSAILIDGNFGYDDGQIVCYYATDAVLNILKNAINDPLNRLVPIILAIGNNDVGQNNFNSIKIHPNSNGPSYFTYFPQNLGETGVPNITERSSYRLHKLGNLITVILDSNYYTAIGGSQELWLQNISSKYANKRKIGMYHYPLFSPCQGTTENHQGILAVAHQTISWKPMFDNSSYFAIFESHDDIYKRTNPIKDMSYNKQGVIYFGDGNWGAPSGSCESFDNSTGIYAGYGLQNHIWILNVNNTMINYSAVDSSGNIVANSTISQINWISM